MRFKSIFWLFNIIVLIALAGFTSASFLLFGREYAAVYWSNMWIVVVLFVALIGGLDFYFVKNWSLFTLLEKEDWPTLLAWLEDKIYGKGKLNRPYANLLINTALSVSNYDAVKKLNTQVRETKPELLRHIGVSLGIPFLKEQDWKAVADHFTPLADDPGTRHRDWARWCRSIAGDKEADELLELTSSKDASVRVLAFQSLSDRGSLLSDQQKPILDAARSSARTDLAGQAGLKAIGRSRDEHLMAVVLSGVVDDALKALLA